MPRKMDVRAEPACEYLHGQDLIEYAPDRGADRVRRGGRMSSVATKINAAFTNIGTKLTTYTS